MGHQERVFLVEDNYDIAYITGMSLERGGHSVVGHSATVPVESQIKDAVSDGMTVAIVDGSLGIGRSGCTDGIETAGIIRKIAPTAVIIAFTSQPDARYGDLFVMKPGGRLMQDLVDTVTLIPRGPKA